MQNKLIILASVLILSACATTEPVVKVVTQKVEVPVAVPCKTEIPLSPTFNFSNLTIDKDLFEKSKAVLADRHLHIGYESELLAALKSCK